MANICYSSLKITGSLDMVKEVAQRLVETDFDVEKIVPYEEYSKDVIEEYELQKKCTAIYLEKRKEIPRIYKDEEDKSHMYKESEFNSKLSDCLREILDSNGLKEVRFNSYFVDQKNHDPLNVLGDHNKRHFFYGSPTWIGDNAQNVKKESFDESGNQLYSISLCLNSKWTIPGKSILALSYKYPSLHFACYYSDYLADFAGTFICQNGEVIEDECELDYFSKKEREEKEKRREEEGNFEPIKTEEEEDSQVKTPLPVLAKYLDWSEIPG